MTDVCNICVEKYNKSVRKPIKCQYCEFESCAECCKRYIVNQTHVKCMNTECNREWTRCYISTVFPKKFINTTLKHHRENLLFDRERALLPATQPIVEEIIRKEQIEKEMNETLNVIYDLRLKYNKLRRSLQHRVERERAVFIRACPEEECRGFLDEQWKCGICSNYTCKKCNNIKGMSCNDNHTCNPDDVATMSLLNTDTKPCPKCKEGIFKIDGCDQLWCTQCHTAFSWRTGAIENVIHNPHYYEWRRRTGELEPIEQDICVRELTHTSIDNITFFLSRTRDAETDIENQNKLKQLQVFFSKVIRRILHLRYIELGKYQYNYELNNRNLRIQYMRKIITDEQLKTLLQQQDKRNEKNKEIRDILLMVNNATTDIIYRFLNVIRKPDWKYNENIQKYRNEMKQIVIYANECFVTTSKTYTSIKLWFDELYTLH